MKPQAVFGGALLLALRLSCGALAQNGRVEQVTVHSHALEGNLLGDSPDRAVTVYLPPGYEQHPEVRYPVVYLLHGYTGTNELRLGRGYLPTLDATAVADQLIDSGRIQPLILVMPNAFNKYAGSYFTNSTVTGNWEDFIAHDLVTYVDTHFRTLARPNDRALAGRSMGGYGALILAMKHPDTFGVVYAMSPAYAGLVDTRASTALSPASFDLTLGYLKFGTTNATLSEAKQLAMAAAFSPDPNNLPYYIDLPYKDDNANPYKAPDKPPQRIDAVWARWVAHTPLGMMDDYGIDLLLDRGVAIDVGSNDDPALVAGARAFDKALTGAGIPHTFTEYEGDHTNRIAARFSSTVLPFISDHIEGD